MAVFLGPQLSKLAARISEPFVKCRQRLNDTLTEPNEYSTLLI